MEHHSSILFSEAFTGLDYICDSVNLCLSSYSQASGSLDLKGMLVTMVHYAFEYMDPSCASHVVYDEEDSRNCLEFLRKEGLDAVRNDDGTVSVRLSDIAVNIIPVSSEEYDMEVLSPGLLFRERVVGFSASQFRHCVEEMNSLAREFKALLPGVERYFNKDMALFRIEEATESARFPSRRRKTWSNEMKYAFIYMQKALVKSFLDILTDELGLVLEYVSENICRTRGYEDYHCEISIFGKNGERKTYKVDIYHLGEVTGSILEEFSQEHLIDYAAN